MEGDIIFFFTFLGFQIKIIHEGFNSAVRHTEPSVTCIDCSPLNYLKSEEKESFNNLLVYVRGSTRSILIQITTISVKTTIFGFLLTPANEQSTI